MDRKVLWRIVVIVVVVVLAAVSLYPPEERIKLGLDLRGGIHLVMKVHTDDTLEAELDDAALRLRDQAAAEGVELGSSQVDVAGARFTVEVPGDVDVEVLDDVASGYLRDFRVRRGAGQWVFELPENVVQTIRVQAVRAAKETITNRVDQFGVAEPVIQTQEEQERILVQLPGVDDPARVKELISNTAFLELKEVLAGPAPERASLLASFGGSAPDDGEVVKGDPGRMDSPETYFLVRKAAIITGRELRTAQRSQDRYGSPAVSFSLINAAAEKFGRFTGSHIGSSMAIILDDRVVSAPTIQDQIRDEGIITGAFTMQEAEDLALVLRAGALPAHITYLEERTVGPSLGRDSIVRGVRAAVAGLALVMVFMLVYYRFSGINANVALILNLLLLLGALAYFGGTLTLPGIAGVILTIGMAVDANVLIFQRIREELKIGKTVRSAVEVGFSRAFGTILDANVTTLIAALFLFNFGTGPVKGFAVTLSIGIVASMFTAVFVSRTIYMVLMRGTARVESLSI